jgi:cytochrome c-type biogenesis protein CcmH
MKRFTKTIRSRTLILLAAAAVALVTLARGPAIAFAQMGDDRPIIIESDSERRLFSKLRCMCGGCARLDLVTCTCSYAAARRDELRAQLKAGMSQDEVIQAYVKQFGTDALEIPLNEGANRLVYAVPIVLVLGGAVFVGLMLQRLRGGGPKPPTKGAGGGSKVDTGKRDDYDERLDEELKRLDDE